jgi:hypothetical protein
VRETSKRWPISSGTSGLDELAVQPAAAAAARPAADPAQIGIGAVPGGDPRDARPVVGPVVDAVVGSMVGSVVDGGYFTVRVAVELARADVAGVGGAGRGHHGVRKGTHASFVGDGARRLEGFAEKHTKG